MSLVDELHFGFHYAQGTPNLNAQIKVKPEDFRVDEVLGFDLSGSGEHYCLLIEKTALNTNDVVKILSRFCSVSTKEISYAGMKDKQAITRQWFSIKVGLNREISFTDFEHPALKLIEVTRNIRKIKRGSHKGNNFKIRLKNLKGDLSSLEERANIIKQSGVPNYYAQQRFGKNQDNVTNAQKMFAGDFKVKDRFLRGIYLSAARSYLFNAVLSERVKTQTWDQHMLGDVMSLAGTNSSFKVAEWDEVLTQRLQECDIHPSGPLWGSGNLKTTAQAFDLEKAIADEHSLLCQGLENFGLKQERKALRLCPQDLEIYPEEGGHVMIEFGLGKGTYATSILRELVNIQAEESKI